MSDRRSEWFVPRFGPTRFRLAVGMLFLPYTAMVLSYTVIGAMVVQNVLWDRVAVILIIYFLALGIGAHAFDALGSRAAKPWGDAFSRSTLWIIAVSSVALAYAVGLPYLLHHTPLLWLIAVPEGFFLLAYNLEWFQGRFHSDRWFVLSWGALPVLAGHVIQTNRISVPALLLALAAGLISYVEINASRPYKQLKRTARPSPEQKEFAARYERILKGISLGTLSFAAALVAWRWGG